ncbi:MAG: 3-phosphoserine/phosphohydroxythreonine transaminase [Cardiobacteriaceae bacterium]|nr:3-phosphoserine/phosphohydroxythreonine transaminase [Cardiobacteriaceae bacterium]
MSERIHNFCAGPCTLPTELLQEAQAELLDFQGCGMSVMEISHRSKRFEAVHFETLDLASRLLGAPQHFKALLLQGGAHQQFAMTAQNLLAKGGRAAFVNSGVWAKKAYQEAKRIGDAYELWSGESDGFTSLPQSALSVEAHTRYAYVCSNETVNGVQFHDLPTIDAPLVVDYSSDYYARPVDWDKVLLAYGGVQKNLAPSGLALVFVHESLLEDHPHLPKFFTYKAHADADSLYNTPPTFQIYMLGKMLKWIEKQGGVEAMEAQSIRRSQALYQAIDQSAFYHNAIEPKYRSRTNVVFRTPSDELDTLFWQSAEKEGINGLKGHKIVGGLRASLYNGLPEESLKALLAFMAEFERVRG